MTIKNEKDSPIIGRVCKHATYTVNKTDKSHDLLVCKITNIHENGERSTSFTALEDCAFDFYIVKKKFRNFKDKRDYINANICDKYRSTYARMANNISKILYGIPNPALKLHEAKSSPFVFGCEQSPAVKMKHRFFVKYKKYQETEPYDVAAYDVETDMFKPEQPVIMASTTFKERIYFSADRNWFDEKDDATILRKLKEAEDKYLRKALDERNAVVIYELFNSPGAVVKGNIDKWHEWGPDWMISWNSIYDMEKNEEALRLDGYNLADVYSDPSVPWQYRSYILHPGRTHKVKDDGTTTPLENQERFPTVRAPAKWQWFDGMSFYAIKRAPQGKKESYALQPTAEREDVEGKLYTDDSNIEAYPGTPDWHREMQAKNKYLYCMYNIGDNLVIERLNEKTFDYSLSFPMLIKSSEFFNYPSQPKCISDELSFIAQEYGKVWGTCGNNNKSEFDKYKQDLSDWIALLETEKNSDKGVAIFEGMPTIRSRGRLLVDDLDVTGAYPYGTFTENVSNYTTQIEVCNIQGQDRYGFRKVTVNYASSPKANCVYLCNALHGFPKLTEVEEVWEEILKQEAKKAA